MGALHSGSFMSERCSTLSCGNCCICRMLNYTSKDLEGMSFC